MVPGGTASASAAPAWPADVTMRSRSGIEPVPVQRAEAARCPAGVRSGVHGHPGEDRRGCRLLRALIAGLQVLIDGIL